MPKPWIALLRSPVMADPEDVWMIMFGVRTLVCPNEDVARKLFGCLQTIAPDTCEPEILTQDQGEM